MDTTTQLSNVGIAIVTGIVRSLRQHDRVATGKTLQLIDVVIDGPEHMYITGPAYLIALDKGRSPTSKTGPYQKTGFSFKDSLALWMEARGIDQGKKNDTQKYGPVLWAIYTKINQKGYSGRPGTLTEPLSDQAINEALDNNLGDLANLYASQVVKELFK